MRNVVNKGKRHKIVGWCVAMFVGIVAGTPFSVLVNTVVGTMVNLAVFLFVYIVIFKEGEKES